MKNLFIILITICSIGILSTSCTKYGCPSVHNDVETIKINKIENFDLNEVDENC